MSAISKIATITLNAPLLEVFPLFGPIREKEWAEGWNPRMVTEHSTDVEQHMVFQTEAHADADPQTYTWVLSSYDPDNAFIEYTVFAGERLWWITIRCDQSEGDKAIRATITYKYVGLSEEGDQRNERALEAMYRHELIDWEVAINHYLTTGTQFKHHPTESY